MKRQNEPPLLQELQAAHNPASQVDSLKAVKNLLVGHELRKVEWIGHGILPLLSEILLAKKKRNGKQTTSGSRRQRKISEEHQLGADEDAVFLQATGIVCIIAQGGTSFIEPILHSGILTHLVGVVASDACSVRVALGVLRCLNAVADRLPPSAPTHWLPNNAFANLLYSPEIVGCWARMVGQTTTATSSQQVCSLVVALICKTCTEEKQKKALTETGILSALSMRLASFVVAQGLVLPPSDTISFEASASRDIPAPAPATARLSPLLQAIALLTERSLSRAELFLSSAAIHAVFPKQQGEGTPFDTQRKNWVYQRSSSITLEVKLQNPIDSLLPHIPSILNHALTEHASFPPLGSTIPVQRRRSTLLSTPETSRDTHLVRQDCEETVESPLVAWLIYMIRAESGLCRLMAAKLLVILFKLELVRKSRIFVFCKMLVPMLVRMLEREGEGIHQKPNLSDLPPEKCCLLEETPAILATLVMDDPDLQKAAVDARAIKPLSLALKGTFDSLPDSDVALWWPDRVSRLIQDKSTPERTIGLKGPNYVLRHIMKYREALLKALAALAPFNDDYRKAICDQGVLPCIIDSLKPMILISTPGESRNVYTNSGNPASTLLAACSAIRALTRSVSALRTNLIDAGVASPILKLLTNPDPEIRIAATKVIGNLAMDFSPMKETVGNQTVIKTLCQHAHSANPKLRFESLWSLKQLVVNSTNALKLSVIQELGPSWMKQLISTNPADIPPGVVIGLIDLDFPSRRHLLYDNDDVEMKDLADSHIGGLYDDRPSTLKEDDPDRHTVDDDTEIQEQLLDLVRNLFCGEKASEIIDYIFTEMGQTEFFDILLNRLRHRVIPGPTRRENKAIPAPKGVVTKVLYIIIHLAASISKYRNAVASNVNLMRQVLAYTTHETAEVRAQCCWIAINLIYEDDPSDRGACKHRATELQRVGYYTKLSAMSADLDMDVRERQRTAVHLFQHLLG